MGAGCRLQCSRRSRARRAQLSIAGPGCSSPSRAQAAPLRSRIAAVPSSAAPGHAATRACCSNASAGKLRKPLVQDLHGLNSTARDSCNPRPQWSPGPRSTDAPRARDGRMHPAPAMDGCTMRLRWTAAPRARDRRIQRPPCARPARTCVDVWDDVSSNRCDLDFSVETRKPQLFMEFCGTLVVSRMQKNASQKNATHGARRICFQHILRY